MVNRERLKEERSGITHRFVIHDMRRGEPWDSKGYLTVNCFADGRVGEIFCKMDQCGGTVSGFVDSWAIAVSLLLQTGTTLEEICQRYRGTRFPPAGRTDTNVDGLRVALSPVDYIARWLAWRFLKNG